MDDYAEIVRAQLLESARVKEAIAASDQLDRLIDIARLLVSVYRSGGKVLLCGNGGSAADAQHLVAELVSKFRKERPGLPALALNVNTSILTAIANDYSYDRVFARQVEALGKPGDVLIGISTSGNSASIIEAVKEAHLRDLRTVVFCGGTGGKLKDFAEISFIVPSSDTPRIQEAHIAAGHILCDIVERELFKE